MAERAGDVHRFTAVIQVETDDGPRFFVLRDQRSLVGLDRLPWRRHDKRWQLWEYPTLRSAESAHEYIYRGCFPEKHLTLMATPLNTAAGWDNEIPFFEAKAGDHVSPNCLVLSPSL
jgi:hypothetical protein